MRLPGLGGGEAQEEPLFASHAVGLRIGFTGNHTALILARSRETDMGNIGVTMASEHGSVTGMLEDAGQGDKAAIGQLYGLL